MCHTNLSLLKRGRIRINKFLIKNMTSQYLIEKFFWSVSLTIFLRLQIYETIAAFSGNFPAMLKIFVGKKLIELLPENI